MKYLSLICDNEQASEKLNALIVKKVRLRRALKLKIRWRKERGRKMKTNVAERALNLPSREPREEWFLQAIY